jgi:hypothetical protein
MEDQAVTPNTPSPQEKPTVEQCIAYVENEIAGRYKGPPDVEVLRFILSRLRASQAPASAALLEALLERLQADGGKYLLSVALTTEERRAMPEPTYGGKGHSRWLTEEEHAALCSMLAAALRRHAEGVK